MGRETFAGDVAFEHRGHLGIITLNRPKAVNSLTELMCESVLLQLQEWAEDDGVVQVLIRGAGDRGLCAGGDVVGLHRDMVEHQPLDGGPLLPEGTPAYRAEFRGERFFSVEYEMNRCIAEYPKPYIALMDGLVLGGGIGISAHGSHRLVTERTRTGMPETTIGFSPDVGGTYLLGRAPRRLGLHAGLTGTHLDAADAIALGLADAQIAAEHMCDLIDALSSETVEEVLPRFTVEPEPSGLAAAADWIDVAYAEETAEGILTKLDELGEEIPEAAQAAETLRGRSPVALKVALRAIRAGAQLSLEGALIQEHTIGMHALRSHDFREGIRAQVVDKDRSPRWDPASLEGVDQELVDHYFTPVPGRILTFS